MANSRQIKALLKAHADGNNDHFYSVAMQLAASEAKKGHTKLASELRDLIDDIKLNNKGIFNDKTTSIAKPRGELANLLDVSHPQNIFPQMILSESILIRLNRLIKEQRKYSKIRSYGLKPRRKLLLVGHSGTGKTMTAGALAGELGIPLFLVRLDKLITKYMGETAAKLRLVFDAISNVRGVYFFDEFDAIGSQRGLMNDVGEIGRVLNSFLQMLEQDDSNSVILAATNHPEILDHALYRRFDDVIEYTLPTPKECKKLLRNKLTNFVMKDFDWEKITQSLVNFSYAEITRTAEETIKEAIIHDKNIILERDLLSNIKERKAYIKK